MSCIGPPFPPTPHPSPPSPIPTPPPLRHQCPPLPPSRSLPLGGVLVVYGDPFGDPEFPFDDFLFSRLCPSSPPPPPPLCLSFYNRMCPDTIPTNRREFFGTPHLPFLPPVRPAPGRTSGHPNASQPPVRGPLPAPMPLLHRGPVAPKYPGKLQ